MNQFVFRAILALFVFAPMMIWAEESLLESVVPMQPADSVPTELRDSGSVRESGTYSFGADKIDRHTAIAMFAAANNFRLQTELPLDGIITIQFRNKTLKEALQLLLKDSDAAWTILGDLLRIHSAKDTVDKPTEPTTSALSILETQSPTGALTVLGGANSRIFCINYPRLKRSGSGSSAARVSTSGSGEAGNITLASTDELFFWDEIEKQVKTILGDSATLVINRLSGTLFAEALEERLNMAQKYLEIVVPAATRQVEITARIYEVILTDDRSLGIDWSRVDNLTLLGKGVGVKASSGTIQEGGGYKASTLSLDFSNENYGLGLMIRALKEQGDMQAVSQPRVVTLNNQPALVKVGTDMPFFSSTVTTNATTGAKEVQEQVSVVTVGVVLSVTPQISGDGWITLGIDPMISDLVSTVTSTYGSTAPVIDIKQSSTLVRLRDRETVRISGLLQNKDQTTLRKIPILGDIPFLGALFRWEYKTKLRKELVIFITPKVL